VNKTIPTTFTVSSESNGQRLDVFLAEKLAITRSQVQKLIAQKQVTINSTEPKKTSAL
jgi:23S rRNA-/tRNA-specific pseudouridylate synthase